MKKIIILCLLVLCLLPLTACQKQNELCVYNLQCEYENGTLKSVLDFDYVCTTTKGIDELCFNLFPNAFREGATITPLKEQNDACPEMQIISVSSKDKLLSYKIEGVDKNLLKVKLTEPLSEGDKASVRIEYAAVLPSGAYRYSKGENTVNLGNFYPILCVYENGAYYECPYGKNGDPFYSEVANYSVSLTVPSQIVVASSAKATSCDVGDNQTRYTYSLNNVRDFAFVLSDKFNVITDKLSDTEINYYYFTDAQPEKTLEVIKGSLEYFSESFGKYPYESYSVAQADFNAGGMEYPALTYVNCALGESDTLYTAVHETAHQWWYGMVGNNQLEEAFLDESLAEYSTVLFFSAHPQYGIDGDSIINSAKRACISFEEVLKELNLETDNVIAKNLSDYKSEYEYVIMNYSRGLVMMDSVEKVIGRETTINKLKHYFNKNCYKTATTESFLTAMQPADKIINSYLSGRAQINP